MPYFQYKGLNKKGQIVSGKKKGASTNDVKEKLYKQGIAAKELKILEGVLYKDLSIGKKVSTKEFVLFLRQLSTLLQAGITLVEAMNILIRQTEKKSFRIILSELENELRAGVSFSEATSKYPSVFSSLFVNMVRAGEASGNLDGILDRLASLFEKQYDTRRKVISALTYPSVIGVVAVAVVFFLLMFIVPTFADMYESFDAELPTITLMVLNAGELFGRWWWIVLVTISIVPFLMKVGRRQSSVFLHYTDFALLKLPIFGVLLQKAAIARMTRTLSSLLGSSVPIISSLSIAQRVSGNEIISVTLQKAKGEVERGESIASPLEKDWVFPPMVTQMIAVGETSGSLDSMLSKVADYYEAEVDATTDQIKSLIEPIMILILAAVVGIIVASIAVPMFDMFDAVQ
ncbi:type II secretion system F family protein [Salibacterium salarium]|uniref:Type II secretion system F family protein n=1 Tax=Salibacterium salarium TaxID=284579 RepID=A0A428N1C4_9BACI|nr:type II secretion system F family protein [Salibacterium salarium]RSL32264.1 type II secretion system F family protein [Salibacterium salarium]